MITTTRLAKVQVRARHSTFDLRQLRTICFLSSIGTSCGLIIKHSAGGGGGGGGGGVCVCVCVCVCDPSIQKLKNRQQQQGGGGG